MRLAPRLSPRTTPLLPPARAPQTAQVTATVDTFAPATLDDVRSGRVLLGPGSQGDAVRAVQERLHLVQDGLFGPATAAAVIAFKAEDGVITPPDLNPAAVGPTTLQELFKTTTDVSPRAQAQMNGLLTIAQANCLTDDGASWGHCYGAVWGYLLQAQAGAGYGNGQLPGCDVPGAFAAQFGEWLNEGDHAASVGLRRLDLTNPFDAPPGAIVVVGAGSPGCSTHDSHGASYALANGVSVEDYQAHPLWPGDISIASGDGVNFINDHDDESYGGSRDAWEQASAAGNATLLGVYVPVS
jgi:hypothetical protein